MGCRRRRLQWWRGVEPLNALRGVNTLKRASVASQFQWVSGSTEKPHGLRRSRAVVRLSGGFYPTALLQTRHVAAQAWL